VLVVEGGLWKENDEIRKTSTVLYISPKKCIRL
jgi:hypothetical protein